MNSINQFIGRWVCNDCDIDEKEMKMSGNEVTWKHGGGGGPYKIKNVQTSFGYRRPHCSF